jgi:beta-lactamase regulating signal transducer with metallopeptidase domain
MSALLDSAAKISLLLVVGLAVASLMRNRSAAARHWVLAVAVGCAALMPLLAVIVPSWHLPAMTTPADDRASVAASIVFDVSEPPAAARVAANEPQVAPTPVVALTPGRVAGIVWVGGVIVSLGLLAAGIVRLAAFRARARPVPPEWSHQARAIASSYGIRRPVALFETEHEALLVTWGAIRPEVMLPPASAQWSPERIRIVLAHELAHIRRGDWAVQMLAELLRAFLWFNPLVWLACRRLRVESEYACDDMVLSLGVNRTAYAAHLLDLARAFHTRGGHWLPAPAIARPSTLQRRIRAMLTSQLNRSPLHRSVRITAVALLAGMTLALAGFSGQTFGSVVGTIADAQGGAVANATLSLSNVASQSRHEVRSDETGRFEFVGLPGATYILDVAVPGFQRVRETLTLAPGQVQHRALTLQIGTLQETIRVTYGADSRENRAPSTAGARIAPPARPCTPSSIGGRIAPPSKVRDFKPRVSDRIIDQQLQGTIVLEATIGVDGLVKEVRPADGVDPDLEAAATAAVKEWVFTPTTLNCVPVEVSMTVTVTFAAQ